MAAKPGATLKILGIVILIAGALFYALAGDIEQNPIGFVGAIAMALGMLVYFRGRQQAARGTAALAPPMQSAGPHILYLRSFRTDVSGPIGVLASGFSTEEEQLAAVLRPFGQMIAIGKPGEPLPVPGAARVYASDSEWKGIVLSQMQSAPLVVIRASTRRGLLWEVEQAVRTIPPHKILFFILNMTMQDYHQFTARVRDDLGILLPDIPAFSLLQAVVDFRQNPSKAQSGFLYFPNGWTPAFLPLPNTIVRLGYNDLRASFNTALRPVFEQHGIPWQPLGRFQG